MCVTRKLWSEEKTEDLGEKNAKSRNVIRGLRTLPAFTTLPQAERHGKETNVASAIFSIYRNSA
jgi:hypothetical protein